MIDSPVTPTSSCRPRPSQGQAPAGIHDFLCGDEDKSWIPAFAGMTRWVSPESRSFGRLVSEKEFVRFARRLDMRQVTGFLDQHGLAAEFDEAFLSGDVSVARGTFIRCRRPILLHRSVTRFR